MLLSKMNWGIPTPLSLIESRWMAPDAFIIASGGIWNGVYAAKMIALGSNLVGLARPILKTLVEHGYNGVKRYLEKYIEELKITMYLTGTRTPSELCIKPVVLGPNIRYYMESRGINIGEYLEKNRCSVIY